MNIQKRHMGFALIVTLTVLAGTSMAGAKDDLSPSVYKHASAGDVSPSSVSAPVKFCSAIVPGNWRDTITVPDGWSMGMCSIWAQNVGASHYQLGCGFWNGWSWGGGVPVNTFATLPAPGWNCGWASAW